MHDDGSAALFNVTDVPLDKLAEIPSAALRGMITNLDREEEPHLAGFSNFI
ncbi:hypothetical protein J5X84_26755 [Streptosporangiaceae bacterium NEAU-GS5]|nr:hypothetical protein [Streptosporangiaceae bacterium NEAU-GS5]